jgi:hypothetical protein
MDVTYWFGLERRGQAPGSLRHPGSGIAFDLGHEPEGAKAEPVRHDDKRRARTRDLGYPAWSTRCPSRPCSSRSSSWPAGRSTAEAGGKGGGGIGPGSG